MALLFLILFVCFGVIIVMEIGNPITYHQAKEKIEQYIYDHYATLYDNFDVSSIRYFVKDHSYGLVASDKKNEHLSFRIYYGSDKKVYDSYQTDYVEGNNLRAIIGNRLTDKLEQKIKKESLLSQFDSYRISIVEPMNQLNKKDREQLITNQNVETLNIYTVEASTTVSQMNAKLFSEQFEAIHQGTKNIDFHPKAYSLFICKEDDGNDCVEIQNVSKEIIESEDLTTLFQAMIQDKNKVENQYKIRYDRIEKK